MTSPLTVGKLAHGHVVPRAGRSGRHFTADHALHAALDAPLV
jgi:hypothetical protein